MIKFTKRNLTLYFRDKGSVFFSLMAVMITFLLYIFVFRNLYGQQLFGSLPDMRSITDIWAICGIISAPTVTAPLGSLWVLVDDKKRKHYHDFYTSPISRWKITGGYLLSSFLVGIIMTCALMVVTQVYLLINGASLFSLTQYLMMLGVIILSTFSGSGLVLFLVSLFPGGDASSNAYTGCSIVIGTLIGFISGNYIPSGLLPEAVQFVIKLCPVAHTSALFRQITVTQPMQELLGSFGFDNTSLVSEYLGIQFKFGSYTAEPWVHVAVLLVTGIVFYGLAILNLGRKRVK